MTLAWLVIALSLGWVAFGYLGYPLALAVLRAVSPRPVLRADRFPPLSVILAVHDGERFLRRKLEATLALDYPGPVQVIVASDGSTDATNTIAAEFAARGVELVALATRGGKESAQAAAVAQARGEIVVFSDVTAELEKDALRAIVRPFADPTVGCVSSEDRVQSAGGEGAYVRYEMALRRLESEATTLVGLSGSFFAARRELCTPFATDLASDFRTALEAARRGLRAVAEPAARARFRALDEVAAEWPRKVRTVGRGIAVLLCHTDLLHPRHGRAAFSLWGHKVSRFTSPFALLACLVASALAAPASPAAAALLAAQLAFYALAGLALAVPAVERLRIPRLAAFFVLVNASTLVAWLRHWSGRRVVAWTPTRRA
jgi:cellulose synthase/poly-beta-1,6-N-acetylglucosamine synthase-like glycosyltransferase